MRRCDSGSLRLELMPFDAIGSASICLCFVFTCVFMALCVSVNSTSSLNSSVCLAQEKKDEWLLCQICSDSSQGLAYV